MLSRLHQGFREAPEAAGERHHLGMVHPHPLPLARRRPRGRRIRRRLRGRQIGVQDHLAGVVEQGGDEGVFLGVGKAFRRRPARTEGARRRVTPQTLRREPVAGKAALQPHRGGREGEQGGQGLEPEEQGGVADGGHLTAHPEAGGVGESGRAGDQGGILFDDADEVPDPGVRVGEDFPRLEEEPGHGRQPDRPAQDFALQVPRIGVLHAPPPGPPLPAGSRHPRRPPGFSAYARGRLKSTPRGDTPLTAGPGRRIMPRPGRGRPRRPGGNR